MRDLPSVIKMAYNALPEEQREGFLEQYNDLRNTAIRSGIAAILSRNLSHNPGKHIQRRCSKE